MSTKPVLEPDRAAAADRRPPAEDIRAARPLLLQRGWRRATVRRAVSIGVLALLDAAWPGRRLYVALALRELVYGGPRSSGAAWEGPETWLPFLAPITCLVFLQVCTRRASAGPAWARWSVGVCSWR